MPTTRSFDGRGERGPDSKTAPKPPRTRAPRHDGTRHRDAERERRHGTGTPPETGRGAEGRGEEGPRGRVGKCREGS